jgi:hypothetical protein
VSLNTDGNEFLIELERSKIQSESQKKELQHLQKIITLLEEQIAHLTLKVVFFTFSTAFP